MLFIFGAEKQDMVQIKSISDMKTNRKQLSEKKTGAQSRLNGFFSNMCVCSRPAGLCSVHVFIWD